MNQAARRHSRAGSAACANERNLTMNDSFNKFGGTSAIIVGVLSILYAIFYLIVKPQAPFVGELVSWLILAASGIFSLAAYVALYQRTRGASEGYALYGLLFGIVQSMATLLGSQVMQPSQLLRNSTRKARPPSSSSRWLRWCLDA
jgi:hypothetical protein